MMTAERILYEDNHLIIINKQPSEIVQGDITGDPPLSETIKSFLKQKYEKPGNVFLGVTHRLDRPVSGAIVFAKTSKALSRLNTMFKEKAVRKTYRALCLNRPTEDAGHLQHFLIKDTQKNKTAAFASQVDGGKFSELNYLLLKTVSGNSLLEVEPLTGRPHQIRVQLAAIGCIIKGDLKYGAPAPNPDKSICLHSYKVEFIHPVSEKKISITAPILNAQFWNGACHY